MLDIMVNLKNIKIHNTHFIIFFNKIIGLIEWLFGTLVIFIPQSV